MSGICLDALNEAGRPSLDELREAGADGARLVALDAPEFFAYSRQFAGTELKLAVVIARESCGNDDFAGWAAYYSERVWPDWWVIGNEPDGYLLENSFSSWAMRPAEYAELWRQCAPAIRERQARAQLSVAGLAAGQPWWLSGILPLLDPPPDGVDIHPYAKDAEEARTLLKSYGAVWDSYFRSRRP